MSWILMVKIPFALSEWDWKSIVGINTSSRIGFLLTLQHCLHLILLIYCRNTFYFESYFRAKEILEDEAVRESWWNRQKREQNWNARWDFIEKLIFNVTGMLRKSSVHNPHHRCVHARYVQIIFTKQNDETAMKKG